MRLLHSHSSISCLVATSWACLTVSLLFPDRLETEPGISCIDSGGGDWFVRVAEQSPHTSYERSPASTRRSTCPPLLRLVIPSSDSVHQQAAVSGSQQQPASSNVINPRQTSNVGSCGKLQRCDCSEVEKSWKEGSRIWLCVVPSTGKHSCLRDNISMITLKEKPGELFKV